MAASDSAAGPEEEPRNEPAVLTSKLDSSRLRMSSLGRLFPDAAFVIVIIGMFALGALLIILYVVSTAGPHLRYISVGLFTACAAFLIGTVVGLVLAIPRFVSSGAYRHQMTTPGINQPSIQEPDGPSTDDAEPKPAEVTGGRVRSREKRPVSCPVLTLRR